MARCPLGEFTVAWLSVMIWGGAFNWRTSAPASRPSDPPRGRVRAEFSPFATFLNVTAPIGRRIALPSSINTYISVVKNTSLMYVIGYPGDDDRASDPGADALETVEAFTVLAVTYLILVWTMSALIGVAESRLALPEEAR